MGLKDRVVISHLLEGPLGERVGDGVASTGRERRHDIVEADLYVRLIRIWVASLANMGSDSIFLGASAFRIYLNGSGC